MFNLQRNAMHVSPTSISSRTHSFRTHPSRTFATGALALLVAALFAAPAAQAQASADSPAAYLQGGVAEHDANALTVGAMLPWKGWEHSLWGGQLTAYWDVYVSRWTADAPGGGDMHTTVVGVTPTFRLRHDDGRSPWFTEAGIGATLASPRYVTAHKTFSTAFNFASHLGLGYSFGAQRQHELMLRLQHVSNASIKKPNPGENFVQLRYALHF